MSPCRNRSRFLTEGGRGLYLLVWALTPGVGIGVVTARNAERLWGLNYNGIARLKPGVTPDQAQADTQALARDLAIRFPDTNRQMGVPRGS